MIRCLMAGLCVFAVVGLPLEASAQRVSKVNGTRLLALCSSKMVEGCDAYVAGVADALTEQHAACIPPAVTATQLRAVVLKLLHDQPDKLQLSAGKLVVHAFTTAYNCTK